MHLQVFQKISHRPNTKVAKVAIMTSVQAETIKSLFSTAEAEGYSPAFYDYFADNCVWTITGSDSPFGGTYSSKPEILAAFKENAQYWEGELKPKLTNLLLSGNTAVCEITSTGITKKGIPTANEHCWICEFEDGKIVKLRAYMDSALAKRVRDEAGQ